MSSNRFDEYEVEVAGELQKELAPSLD